MKAGTLRHSVIIKTATTSRNSYGEEVRSWVPFAHVRCGIVPKSARENVTDAQMDHEITHRVSLRYIDGLGPKMRIYFGDRILEIKSLINVGERSREMVLMCSEILNG